jgi:hypothetical protein
MVERIILVADADTVYVYQESQAEAASIVYHVMTGANSTPHYATIPHTRWDRVHVELVTDPGVHIVDMRPDHDTWAHTARRTPSAGNQKTGTTTGGRDRDDVADLSGFDTATHHAVQKPCRHVIHCAVDTDTRAGVIRNLDYARRVGDMAVVPVLLAQLTGPCTRMSAAPAPGTGPVGQRGRPAGRHTGSVTPSPVPPAGPARVATA